MPPPCCAGCTLSRVAPGLQCLGSFTLPSALKKRLMFCLENWCFPLGARQTAPTQTRWERPSQLTGPGRTMQGITEKQLRRQGTHFKAAEDARPCFYFRGNMIYGLLSPKGPASRGWPCRTGGGIKGRGLGARAGGSGLGEQQIPRCQDPLASRPGEVTPLHASQHGGQSLEEQVTGSLCLGRGTTSAAPSGREHTCSAPPFQQTAPMESPGARSLTGLPCLRRDRQGSEGTPAACAFPVPSFLMAAPPSLWKR